MAEGAELTNELKTAGVHDAARTAFKILFVYFHGLGLREKIDVTMEQDGFKYQLLFKAVREESNSEVGKEEQDNIEMITGHPDRNWEEDFSHENGKYINRCYGCELHFMGHKRRTRCKKCCVGKEETEKESQESMLAEIGQLYYNAVERGDGEVSHILKDFEIRRKNPTV
jgi:hypothetical protein